MANVQVRSHHQSRRFLSINLGRKTHVQTFKPGMNVVDADILKALQKVHGRQFSSTSLEIIHEAPSVEPERDEAKPVVEGPAKKPRG